MRYGSLGNGVVVERDGCGYTMMVNTYFGMLPYRCQQIFVNGWLARIKFRVAKNGEWFEKEIWSRF